MSAQHESHNLLEQSEEDVHDTLEHVVNPRTYLGVFALLLVLTGLTVLASYFELGTWSPAPGLTIAWNPIVALFIAVVKAVTVVLFFMHVKYSSKLTKLTVGAGLFMFLTLVGMTLSDYFSRAWGRW